MNENSTDNTNALIVKMFMFIVLLFISAYAILTVVFMVHFINGGFDHSTRSNSVTLTKQQFEDLLGKNKQDITGKATSKPTSKPASYILPVTHSVAHLERTNYYISNQNRSYGAAIRYASHLTGVSQDIIKRVIYQESGGDPNIISPTGAVGLMQLIPNSGGNVGYRLLTNRNITPSVGYLQNSWNNIVLGTLYIKYLMRQFPGYDHATKLALALASYNWGIAHIDYLLQIHPVHSLKDVICLLNKDAPSITRHYVSNIMQVRTVST